MELPTSVTNLGFLPEPNKADLIAGAAALLQPSKNESLSLVALEAWQAGVPVICRAGCAVLAGHLQRCGGGRGVANPESFNNTLNDPSQRPGRWKQMGGGGREYWAHQYSSPT